MCSHSRVKAKAAAGWDEFPPPPTSQSCVPFTLAHGGAGTSASVSPAGALQVRWPLVSVPAVAGHSVRRVAEWTGRAGHRADTAAALAQGCFCSCTCSSVGATPMPGNTGFPDLRWGIKSVCVANEDNSFPLILLEGGSRERPRNEPDSVARSSALSPLWQLIKAVVTTKQQRQCCAASPAWEQEGEEMWVTKSPQVTLDTSPVSSLGTQAGAKCSCVTCPFRKKFGDKKSTPPENFFQIMQVSLGEDHGTAATLTVQLHGPGAGQGL